MTTVAPTTTNTVAKAPSTSTMGGVGGQLWAMLSALKSLMTEIEGYSAQIQQTGLQMTMDGATAAGKAQKDAADDRAMNAFLDAGTSGFSAVADGYQSYKGMKLNKDLAAKSAKVDTDLEALQTRKDAFTNKGRPADNIVIGGAPGQTSRPAHQTNNVNALKRGDTTQDPNNPLNPLTAQQEANLTMDAGEYDAINEKIDTKMRTLESNKETLTRTMQYNQTKYQTYGEIAKNTAKALSTGVQGYYMQDEGNQNNLATLENAKKDMSQQTASSAGGAVTQAANELASMLRDIRAASNPKA